VDEVNLDTVTAIAFVSEASTVRHFLKARVSGKQMIMTTTAYQEFVLILKGNGGPQEQARGALIE
jgi:hypothetical protein